MFSALPQPQSPPLTVSSSHSLPQPGRTHSPVGQSIYYSFEDLSGDIHTSQECLDSYWASKLGWLAWPVTAEAGPFMLWKKTVICSGLFQVADPSVKTLIPSLLSLVSSLEIKWWTLWWPGAWALGPSCCTWAVGILIRPSKRAQAVILRLSLNSGKS